MKSLILIVVSACITGAFALVVAWLQIRANREMHDRIDRIEGRQISVAKQAGADPRWPPRDEEEAK